MSGKISRNRTGKVCHRPVFDPVVTMASVQGDDNLLRELIGLLLESVPGNLSQIRDAIVREDSLGLERSAHELRGAVKIFGASYVYENSLALEQMGRCGDLSNAQRCYARLVNEMGELEQGLADFIKAG